MDYFLAVQEGRKRVQRAVSVLQEVAGPSYPMLFLKIGVKDWTPVGDEIYFGIIPGKNDTASVVLCDSEGNTKAMSTWASKEKAEGFGAALAARSIQRFDGELKLPV